METTLSSLIRIWWGKPHPTIFIHESEKALSYLALDLGGEDDDRTYDYRDYRNNSIKCDGLLLVPL